MADKTDGVAATEQVATEAEKPEQTPTTTPADSGAQERINALVAERNRKDKQVQKLQEQMEELTEKYKTEDEKRIDALVEERIKSQYGEKLQRLDSYESELSKRRDSLVEQIPEEHRHMIDDSASVFKQLQQAEGVIALLGKESPKPTGRGDNPPEPPDPKTYSWDDWTRFQQLPYKGTQEALAEYDKAKEEMFKAYREGRIRRPN